MERILVEGEYRPSATFIKVVLPSSFAKLTFHSYGSSSWDYHCHFLHIIMVLCSMQVPVIPSCM